MGILHDVVENCPGLDISIALRKKVFSPIVLDALRSCYEAARGMKATAEAVLAWPPLRSRQVGNKYRGSGQDSRSSSTTWKLRVALVRADR